MTRRNARVRATGKGKSAPFVQLPRAVLDDPAFQALSAPACKAVLFLSQQYRGNNNGDFTIAWRIAKDRGWTSKGALHRAVAELVDTGFAMLTRQGGRNHCSLYALTWFAIDHCDGKLDVPATAAPPRTWSQIGRNCGPPVVQRGPPAVQSQGNAP